MPTLTAPSRRTFLQIAAGAGGGLVAAFYLPPTPRFAQAAATQAASTGTALQPNVFVRVTPDNWVTVVIGHTEMGQGASTVLPMMVAEELDADWQRVRWEQGPTAPEFAHPILHSQLTGGSLTTPAQFMPQRQAGAAVRAVLVAAAAKRWNVDAATLRTERSRVIDTKGSRSASYGELAAEAVGLPVPEKPVLKDPKHFTIIGKPLPRLDGPAKADGSAIFGIDVYVPNMLTAVVAHAPLFGGKARGFDATKTKAVPGVVQVVEIPTGIAVVAKDFWAAKKGRDVLTVDWDPVLGERLSSDDQRIAYQKLLDVPGMPAKSVGDVSAATKTAARTITGDYFLPYLAHAPMEPLGAVVDIRPDRAELWISTQWPGGNQDVAAEMLGLKKEQVTVHTTLTGGGFGRRSFPGHDFVREAIQIGQATKAPVKLIWTREDDIKGGAYRPAAAARMTATLDAKGTVTSIANRIVVQSIIITTPFAKLMIKDGIDPVSVEGSAFDMPYAIPNSATDLHTPDYQVPVTWMRSVGHSFNAFIKETFIDDLAHAARQDPVAFRRGLLTGKPRFLTVLDAAAKAAGWSTPPEKGVARGLALHESYGAVVANIVEASVSATRQLTIHRVVCAIDCGLVINPDLVKAQMESGIVFSLSSALFGEITLRKGVVDQGNFDDYPLVRMHQTPKIDVVLIDSREPPAGAGEPGAACIAPALGNAIFAATGERIRTLPLKHHLQIA